MPRDSHEDINRISRILFDYNEASEEEIFARIEYLVDLEKSVDAEKVVRGGRFRAALEKLNEIVELGEDEENG